MALRHALEIQCSSLYPPSAFFCASSACLCTLLSSRQASHSSLLCHTIMPVWHCHVVAHAKLCLNLSDGSIGYLYLLQVGQFLSLLYILSCQEGESIMSMQKHSRQRQGLAFRQSFVERWAVLYILGGLVLGCCIGRFGIEWGQTSMATLINLLEAK